MTARRFAQLEALFDALVGRPEPQRRAILGQIEADDPELAREVAELLAADAESATGIEAGPRELAETPRSPPIDPVGPGSQLGPFRLDRQLSTGGMGRVFIGRRVDGAYDTQVAVKVLRRAVAAPDTTARFRTERQILARLDHPHIARLLDGGETDDGRPWLAMEWIDGLPIDRHADRHRLSLDDRLRLMRQICDAVDHAHRHLLVHRDLKPSNILISAEHGAKLLDFGIAKVLAESEVPPTPDLGVRRTATGRRFLSLAYASPEQAAGEPVGVASDIYSLGVLLFELLAGRSPYDPAGAETRLGLSAAARRVAADPLRPVGAPADPAAVAAARGLASADRLCRRLDGDLDAVVGRALARAPAARYRSAAELAAEIDRLLDGRPVRARPLGPIGRAGRVARRQPGATLAGAIAASLIVGLTVGWAVHAVDQAGRLAAERDDARHIASTLADLFDTPSIDTPIAHHIRALDLVDSGVRRLDSAKLVGGPSPSVSIELLTVYSRAYRQLGQARVGLDLARRSETLAVATHGADSVERARSLIEVAEAELDLARLDRGLGSAEEAVSLLRDRLGDEHPDVARALGSRGRGLSLAGRHREAEETLRRALAIFEATSPGSLETAEALAHLARSHGAQGRHDVAGQLLRDALAMRRQRFGDRSAEAATGLFAVAEAEAVAGRRTTAIHLGREALELRRGHFGDSHPSTLSAMTRVAEWLLQHCDGRAEARGLLGHVVDLRRRLHGDDDSTLVDDLATLATLEQNAGDELAADALLDEAETLAKDRVGHGTPRLARVHFTRADILRSRGQTGKAEALLRSALAALPVEDVAGQFFLRRALGGLLCEIEPGSAEGLELLDVAADRARRVAPADHWRLVLLDADRFACREATDPRELDRLRGLRSTVVDALGDGCPAVERFDQCLQRAAEMLAGRRRGDIADPRDSDHPGQRQLTLVSPLTQSAKPEPPLR